MSDINDLVALETWFRAQVADDEHEGGPGHCAGCISGSEFTGTMYECDIDAARVRARRVVEAKRQILDELDRGYDRHKRHPGDAASAGALLATLRVIRILALAYDNRPGYRDEWRP